jgi:hypothetical protein
MAETFTEATRLAKELNTLRKDAESQGDPALQREVVYFIMNVCDEADKAFDDVDKVLSRISSLSSGASEKVVMKLQKDVQSTYSREKFKKIQKICGRLDELGQHFDTQIKPRLDPGYVSKSSQLFWLLEKDESMFIYTIERAFYYYNAESH